VADVVGCVNSGAGYLIPDEPNNGAGVREFCEDERGKAWLERAANWDCWI
jgi:hypothetical protein